MALASFAPSASVSLAVTQQSSNVQLPSGGSPTTALVTNPSDQIVFAVLGVGNTTAAVPGTSLAMLPRSSIPLTIGSNTYLAACTLAGVANLNITVGT